MEYELSHRQLEHLKHAAAHPWGRVSIIAADESAPLVTQGWLQPVGESGFTFEITDRGIEFLGLDVQATKAAQEKLRETPPPTNRELARRYPRYTTKALKRWTDSNGDR